MSVIDYAIESVNSYKREKALLDNFINEEIVIPCKTHGVTIKRISNNVNMYDNERYKAEDTYIINLNGNKKIELAVKKLESCRNGSKYILECIYGIAVVCRLYTSPDQFTDYYKRQVKETLGKIIGEFVGNKLSN